MEVKIQFRKSVETTSGFRMESGVRIGVRGWGKVGAGADIRIKVRKATGFGVVIKDSVKVKTGVI